MLVRHGDVSADMARYWGRTDMPLSAAGERQAGRLAQRLAVEDIGVVYSSDLRRALDTARPIAARHGLFVTGCPELREIDFGLCEGLTFDEVRERFPSVAEDWTSGGRNIEFPGGESLAGLASRLGAFSRALHSGPPGAALVVAHGGSLRVLACLLTGADVLEWHRFHFSRASLTVVEADRDGCRLVATNDCLHLDREGA